MSGDLDSGPFDELNGVVTFDDDRYVWLDAVLERYVDLDAEMRAAFSN